MKQKLSPTFAFFAAIALACALGAAAVPSLAKPHGQSPTQAADQVARFSVSGTVEAVDYDANSVTIKSGGKRLEVSVTPTTAIDDRGQVGGIADIHRGRKIAASGILRNGVMVAQSIQLR